ncbi:MULTISPECIES: RDD family protein [unclassified Streptomyces]|uniref:RDD family protein n=1 Tax=unclassified Streptomyces TaxID=2593676 RepID=UPI0040435190
MSAPTPAPGDERPREGYYPDPSIPGYVRYWNGASWVPGTSRPAPKDGERLTPPPGVRPAVPAVEETGPHFFDEDPQPAPSAQGGPGAWTSEGQGGAGAWTSEGQSAAGAWSTDAHGGSGHAGNGDQGTAAGAAQQAEPGGQGAGASGAGAGGHGAGQPGAGGHGGGDGRAAWGADPRVPAAGSTAPGEGDDQDPGGTFIFRRPVPGPAAVTDDGTMTFRPVPGQARRGAQPAAGPQTSGAPASGADPAAGPGFGPHGAPQGPGFAAPAAGDGAAPGGFGPQGPVGSPASPAPASPASPAPASPVPPSPASPATASPAAGPGFGAGKAAAARAAAAQTPPQAQPTPQAQPAQAAVAPPVPAQGGAPVTPVTSGPGGGQASWAQQVHQLAGGGDEQPVAPWKPPVEDPFQAAARRQAAARPAGLGKRFAARLIDTLVVGAVTAAAAVPLGLRAADHIQQKIDAARLSGREVTVWLLDGTTGTSLGIVLAVLLLAGVGYEVLPTAKWGRTLGKKLLGIEVRDIEAHEPPAFGAALRRWLAYSVPGLLGIGIVGVLWCLFDRPWRQCWHDKAAHTFVAG